MLRALALLIVTSALVSLSAFAFNIKPVLTLNSPINCSAPALWSGVVTVPPTTPFATTVASRQHDFNKRAPSSVSGVWLAYACQSGHVHVYDVLANAPLWSSDNPLSGETFAPSFGDDGSVYATSTSEVVKFDLLNGTRLWTRYDNQNNGSALAAADVVYVPHSDGDYAVLNATTGHKKDSLSFISNLVTNGNYSAGLTDGTLQFYFNGQPVSSPNLDATVQAPTAANGDVFCASEVNQAFVDCVNTKKAPSSLYQVPLGTSFPFAMAGDDLVIGIDSSGIAQICNLGTCWAMQSDSAYIFAAGVSAPLLPVPRNATSGVIFGGATTQEDGNYNYWLVGFDLNDNHQTALLNSMPIGLPAAVFHEQSQTMYVAITTSAMKLHVYTAGTTPT